LIGIWKDRAPIHRRLHQDVLDEREMRRRVVRALYQEFSLLLERCKKFAEVWEEPEYLPTCDNDPWRQREQEQRERRLLTKEADITQRVERIYDTVRSLPGTSPDYVLFWKGLNGTFTGENVEIRRWEIRMLAKHGKNLLDLFPPEPEEYVRRKDRPFVDLESGMIWVRIKKESTI